MEITAKRLALVLAVALTLAACETDPLTPQCEYNYDVSWDTGGYSPDTGWIRAESVEYLSSGAVLGIDAADCGEFFVSAGEAVIYVRSR